MSKDIEKKIRQTFLDSISVKKEIVDNDLDLVLLEAGKVIADSIANGGKLLICGNGGSAADAQHLAAELLVRLKPKNNRKGLPAIALSLDISTMTACSNDFGFDKIYERSLESLANSNDVLIVITTSGNSKNILNAVKKAKKMNVLVFGFLGSKGGKVLKYCDDFFLVPSSETGHIQESHITGGHSLVECIEENLETLL